MKAKFVIATAAALSLPSFGALAAEPDPIRACMDTFVAQNFPDRVVSYRVKAERPASPLLIAFPGTQYVDLVATVKATGEVIASATCKVKPGDKEGKVNVGPIVTT
jgi:hypothetical protein